MKQLKYCMILVCFFATIDAIGQVPFTAGNIVVCRIGTGAAVLDGSATLVFLDEYTPAGTLVQSVPMPNSISGSNNILTLSGNAVTEGLINLSTDRQYIVIAGYGAPAGTPTVNTTAGTTWPRVIALVNYNANINSTTGLTDFCSGGRPQSAITTNGTDLWMVGIGSAIAGGTRYATVGSSTSTLLTVAATTTNNNNTVGIAGGQLYVSRTHSSLIFGAVGTGLPTTGGQAVTTPPGLPTSGNLGQFVFADLDAGVAGPDVLYISDFGAAGGITKYSLVGGVWTSNGIVGSGADAFRGLTGSVSGTTVTLHAIRTANQIVTLTDASGYNGAFSGTPTLVATAATNTAFRGLAQAPVVSGSLPVKLSSLTAVKSGKNVTLKWTTSSETNFSHFEIQRSDNGADYKQIGKMSAASSGNANTEYAFTDEKVIDNIPQGSTIRYRLRMVDIDHRFEYSRAIPIKIELTETSTASVYPNPSGAGNDLFVKVNAAKDTRLDIAVLDLAGRILKTTNQARVYVGQNIVPLPLLKNVPPGIYYLKLFIDGKTTFLKIVRQ